MFLLSLLTSTAHWHAIRWYLLFARARELSRG
jgi:hypothetical protein